jgi:isopenicillin N synthase-like dioxygenase
LQDIHGSFDSHDRHRPLFGAARSERDLADRAIMAAAATSGFMVVRDLPPEVPVGRAPGARDVAACFELPQSETRKLWRQKFDPAHQNVYRGWFPLQTGFLTAKEGIDMGADVLHGAGVVRSDDPLRESTPLPPAELLPGWRESVAAYYGAMEKSARH